MDHAGCILGGAENGNAGVGGEAKGFDAFEGLLAVVEDGSHAVDPEVGVGDELGRGPLAGGDAVVGFDVAVDYFDRCVNYRLLGGNW